MEYGELPKVIAENIKLDVEEVAYCLYMPISVPGQGLLSVPPQFRPYTPLIARVFIDEPKRVINEYVYLTVKRMIVGPGVTPNRPGWHADGFGSDDLNYVWYDSVPTVFNDSKFVISDDHIKSLTEFDEQALPENDKTYPCFSLLKLTPSVVHRVQLAETEGMRTFVKISVSKNKYNLKGNSRNHAAPGLSWTMYDRGLVRNDPHKAQLDYFVNDTKSNSREDSTANNPKDDHFA